MATRAELAACIHRMETAFGKSLTEDQIEIWAQELADLSAIELAYGTKMTLRTRTWFPAIAEFRKLAMEAPRIEENRRLEATTPDGDRYVPAPREAREAISLLKKSARMDGGA